MWQSTFDHSQQLNHTLNCCESYSMSCLRISLSGCRPDHEYNIQRQQLIASLPAKWGKKNMTIWTEDTESEHITNLDSADTHWFWRPSYWFCRSLVTKFISSCWQFTSQVGWQLHSLHLELCSQTCQPCLLLPNILIDLHMFVTNKYSSTLH